MTNTIFLSITFIFFFFAVIVFVKLPVINEHLLREAHAHLLACVSFQVSTDPLNICESVKVDSGCQHCCKTYLLV